jgi:hypothetical protein
VFDGVVSLIEGGDAVIPSEDNIEAFIAWVHAHDMFQIPDLATDLLRYAEPGTDNKPPKLPDDLRLIPRKLILQLHENPNASLGSGYRGYPGFSVAQIRDQLELGW